MRSILLWGMAFACGCGGSAPDLVVHCGAGIKPPVEELIGIFERDQGVSIDADYAGSEVLLSKIMVSRSGDVYLPGDVHYVELAGKEGLVLSHRPVCYFVPTILVAKGNPKGIRELRDLLQPEVKLGVGDSSACAIGRKTRKIMEKNGIPWAEVEKNIAFQSMTVNELGAQIQLGSLDAVIVWDAIAGYYEKHGEVVPIPPERNVISTVDAGVLSFSKGRDLAERFVAFLASEGGRKVFRKHCYRVDPP